MAVDWKCMKRDRAYSKRSAGTREKPTLRNSRSMSLQIVHCKELRAHTFLPAAWVSLRAAGKAAPKAWRSCKGSFWSAGGQTNHKPARVQQHALREAADCMQGQLQDELAVHLHELVLLRHRGAVRAQLPVPHVSMESTHGDAGLLQRVQVGADVDGRC